MSRDQSQQVLDLDQWAFGFDSDDDPHLPEMPEMIDTFDDDRVFGAWLGGSDQQHGGERLAGIYATYSLDVAVPGGQVPVAGLTWVAVHPRDRRRGVLRAMIEHHLDDVRTRRGEPFSMLHAAEAGIYGRFGYGQASRVAVCTLSRGADLRDVSGADDLEVDIERADMDRHADLLGEVYDAARAGRVGWVSRPTRGQRRSILVDPRRRRRGAESLRVLTVRDPSELRGYAIFRRRMAWKDGTPRGTVEVFEVVARDAAAARAIWGRLTDLDLTTTIETPDLSLDDPLLSLLVDPRSAGQKVTDALWVRVIDLPATLTARRYAADVDVVLEVTDACCPSNAGRWHLQGGPGGATCTRTDRAAQLGLDVSELGSVYLGGFSLAALAASGAVTVHDQEALHRTAIAFSWPTLPYGPWMF